MQWHNVDNMLKKITELEQQLLEANNHITRLKHTLSSVLMSDAEVIETMLTDFENSDTAVWRRDYAVTYWTEKSIEDYAQELRDKAKELDE